LAYTTLAPPQETNIDASENTTVSEGMGILAIFMVMVGQI